LSFRKLFLSKSNRLSSSFLFYQKALVALLCLVFCFHSFLSLIFLEAKLQWIKYEIKEEILGKIPENQLIKFIKPSDFNADEFEENGQMYDVVKIKKTANQSILYCFLDEKETAIGLELEKNIAQHLDKNPFKNQSKKTALLILKSVYENLIFHHFEFNFKAFSNIHFIDLIDFFKTVKLNILAPPPK
jgi:hypothetical protein